MKKFYTKVSLEQNQIENLADGTKPADAVNLSQLNTATSVTPIPADATHVAVPSTTIQGAIDDLSEAIQSTVNANPPIIRTGFVSEDGLTKVWKDMRWFSERIGWILTPSTTGIGYKSGYDIAMRSTYTGTTAGLNSTSTATNSTFVGFSAGGTTYLPTQRSLTGSGNTAVGNRAGANLSGAATSNVFVGNVAGCMSEASSRNVGVGNEALIYDSNQSNNVAIGYRAGYHTRGDNNVAIGSGAIQTGEGSDRIAIGFNSGNHQIPSGQTVTVTNVRIDFKPNPSLTETESGVNSRFVATSTAHGLVVGKTYMGRITSITGNNGSLSVGTTVRYYVADADTLYLGWFTQATSAPFVYGGGHTFELFTPLTNTISVGSGVNPTRSNQIILGNNSATELLTTAKLGLGFNNTAAAPLNNLHIATAAITGTSGIRTPLLNASILSTDANGDIVAGTLPAASNDWKVTGNSGLTAANFLGTTDSTELVFKQNNVEFERINLAYNPTGTTYAPAIKNYIEQPFGNTNLASWVRDEYRYLSSDTLSTYTPVVGEPARLAFGRVSAESNSNLPVACSAFGIYADSNNSYKSVLAKSDWVFLTGNGKYEQAQGSCVFLGADSGVEVKEATTNVLNMMFYGTNTVKERLIGLEITGDVTPTTFIPDAFGILMGRDVFSPLRNPKSATTQAYAINATNYYGIYHKQPLNATNTWFIYQKGPTDKSYFEGKIGIGVETPLNTLHIGTPMVAGTTGIRTSVLNAAALGTNANGDIIAVAGGGSGNTLYTADGTLTGARIVTGANNPLTFTGLGGFTATAGASGTATHTFSLGTSLSFPSYLRGTSNSNTSIWSELLVDADGGFTARSTRDNGTTSTKLVVDAAQGIILDASSATQPNTYTIVNLPTKTTETEVVYINSTTGVLSKGSPIYITPVITNTANYTLQDSDNGKIIRMNSGTSLVVTVPNTLPVGFAVSIFQEGVGVILFSGSGGLTVRNRQSHTKTAGQYAGVGITVVATNEARLTGDTAL